MDEETRYYGSPGDRQGYPQAHPVYRQSPPPRKRKWAGKIIGVSLIIIILLLLIYTPILSYILSNAGPYRAYPAEADFTIQRTITLSGHGTYTVDYPEPVDISNAQDISGLQFTPEPTRETRYGGPWLVWDGMVSGNQVIVMKYTAHTYTLVWNLKSSGSVSEIPDSVKAQYLGNEWDLSTDASVENSDRDGDGRTDIMIEPSAQEISDLAHSIADSQPDVYSKAQALYDYMQDNFRYSTPEEMDYVQQKYGGLPKHSLATLRDGWGDCDEQSMLYISLLRALGIPARMEMGMLYDQQHNTWGGHAWMQVYIPAGESSSWYNVDIVNSEFLVRDCNRLTMWVDDGNGEHLSDYYHVFRGTSHFDSEKLISVSYTPYGEVRVSAGSPEDILNMPGFESALMISSLSIAFILGRTRRKKR